MDEIRHIIIAKQCEIAGKCLILDGCLNNPFPWSTWSQFFLTHISYRRFSLQPNRVLLYVRVYVCKPYICMGVCIQACMSMHWLLKFIIYCKRRNVRAVHIFAHFPQCINATKLFN